MTPDDRDRLADIARAYFAEHTDALRGVEAAHYAYNAPPNEAGGHYFGDNRANADYRHRPCLRCGRTRYQVRYSGADPRCDGPRPDIAATVTAEERKFFAMLTRAPAIVAKHLPPAEDVTGADLARLHHTHGIYPEAVEGALGRTFPEAVHAEYEAATAAHRAASA